MNAPEAPHRRRVLLADDDASTRRVLARSLRDMGLDVVELDDGGRMVVAVAATYREGWGKGAIDLVVTDVHMPVASGIDVVKNLRRAGWRTPIIVMTAYPTKEIEDATLRNGGVLLVKPLDLDTFERTVGDLLGLA